ncbi:MAG TPA: lytic transglycosylase domain-containing protein [Nocardioidaceae bacterium]|nr:lytic transglycosylase domain-containing protein [Nocardioidaceae bacterium]
MRSPRTHGAVVGAALLLTVIPVAAGLTQPEASLVSSDVLAEPQVFTVVQPPATEPVTLISRQTKGKERSERGDRWAEISATGSNDVPEAALRAYRNAADRLASTRPGCQLPWTLLAGIGRVESDHGRYGDSELGSDGVSRPAIIGLPLNGVGPVAAIHDTDDGRLDGDRVWDRAVGPMQFIPSTWRMVAADGDSDGRESPNDIDDAGLAAGHYLCAGGFSVADTSGMARAVFSYNHSDYYVALVMAFQRGYETGVFVIPSPPPPPGEEAEGTKKTEGTKHHFSEPDSDGKAGDGKTGDGKTGGGTTDGGKAGSPPPPPPPPPADDPTSPPPPTVTLSFEEAPLVACDTGYCLGTRKLDLGPAEQLARQAAKDYDGDGTVETNALELDGLVAGATVVRWGYEPRPDVSVVYVIGTTDYRFADGTFA